MFRLLLLSILISFCAFADTPPPGAVLIKGGTDNTKIGNVGDALKVSGTSTISGSVTANQGTGGLSAWLTTVSNSFIPVTQSGVWSTGRTWTLSFATDEVDVSGSSVSITNFPLTFGVTQSTSPWVISAASLPLPSGAATSALQTSGNASLTSIDSKLTSPLVTIATLQAGSNTIGKVDQGLGGASAWKVDGSAVTQPVSGAFFQATQPISVASPVTVAQATAANLNATVVQSSGANLHVNVDSAPTTTVTGTVTANAGTNLNTSALALSANQTNGTQQSKITDGTNVANVKAASTAPVAADPALVVALSPNGNQANAVAQGSTTSGQTGTLIQGAVTTNSPSYTTAQTSPVSLNLRGATRQVITGGDTAQLIRNVYSTTNVTTAAYVQLVASTTSNINRLWIFDSSGQDFVLAVGAAASEVDQIQISPGGWDAPIDLFIPSGSRISIKAVSATANSGILLITGIK